MGNVPGLNPISPSFWVRGEEDIDRDLAALRAQPLQFFESSVPSHLDLPRGNGIWAVVDYESILAMSKDTNTFSSARGITAFDAPEIFNEFFGSMIAMDDPRHGHLRKLVARGFTPRRLAALEATVTDQANLIIDDIADRGEVDFVVDVAARLPLAIVCDLMGVPHSELNFVFDQTNIILGSSDPEYVPDAKDIGTALLLAGGELSEVMKSVAESKRGKDSDDLTTILVNAEVDGQRLTTSDIASFFILLVVAGNETTRNAISWGLHYLTKNPEQRAIWQGDPDGVTGTAVEEIVRLASPVTYMRRTATCDTELDGTNISAGDKLAMFYIAANRDEQIFPDPLRFDVRRTPNRHIGYGGPGPHYCLGAHLARREIGVMFRRLFERLPDIEATSEPDVLQSSFIHGVKHLRASFTPGGSTRP